MKRKNEDIKFSTGTIIANEDATKEFNGAETVVTMFRGGTCFHMLHIRLDDIPNVVYFFITDAGFFSVHD